MSKPIVGIVEWPYIDFDGDQIFEVLTPLVKSIAKSGGLPVGIFPTQAICHNETRLCDIPPLTSIEKEDLLQALRMCDAIIKPGATRIYDHERLIYSYTRDMNIPYLGICAGMQTMSHYGNAKIINERNSDTTPINHYNREDVYVHSIGIVPNTLLESIIGKLEIMVNSRHKFHIPSAGVNTVSAFAPDGVIEAIENPDFLFHLGLQWHPEIMPDGEENSKRIFDGLIDAAYTYKKRKK